MELKSVFGKSHQGPFLEINEDFYQCDLEAELFILLDGFGGVGKGEECVPFLSNHIQSFYKKGIVDKDSTLPFFYSNKYLLETNILINSCLSAHEELMNLNNTKSHTLRSGSSGVVIAKSLNSISLLSTGNCSVYLLRDGKSHQICAPDSLAQYQLDNDGEFKNTISLSGFGLFSQLHYQSKEVRLREGDILVSLSDGVYSHINESEILSHFLKASLTLEERADILFNLSNERGNIDNQSCMVLEF